jgi:hypothetical protein
VSPCNLYRSLPILTSRQYFGFLEKSSKITKLGIIKIFESMCSLY